MQTRSLAWIILASVVTLGAGGILWMAFDTMLIEIFAMDDWNTPTTAETDDVAGDVAEGQRAMQAIWGIVPVILVVAVGFSVLVHARR